MKKGELRKEAILVGAEKLFLQKGYDDTSIQDILDVLSLSKGGFYHYFESKEALLEEICFRNARQSIEKLEKVFAEERLTPVRCVNLILSTVNIFARETPRFCAIMLKISYIDGDVNFRDHLRAFMFEKLLAYLDEAIAHGIGQGTFFTRYPQQIGRILLNMGYDICNDISRRLAMSPDDRDVVIDMIDLLNAYRDSCETLLGASFGSIEIADMEQLLEAFRQTVEYLNMYKGEGV